MLRFRMSEVSGVHPVLIWVDPSITTMFERVPLASEPHCYSTYFWHNAAAISHVDIWVVQVRFCKFVQRGPYTPRWYIGSSSTFCYTGRVDTRRAIYFYFTMQWCWSWSVRTPLNRGAVLFRLKMQTGGLPPNWTQSYPVVVSCLKGPRYSVYTTSYT